MEGGWRGETKIVAHVKLGVTASLSIDSLIPRFLNLLIAGPSLVLVHAQFKLLLNRVVRTLLFPLIAQLITAYNM